MKKVFNLSVILAVLAAAFSFTSCSDDDDDAASVKISVESAVSSAIVTITSDEDLTAVELWQNGSKIKNIDVKSGTNKGKATVNVYTIIDLKNGEKYTVKASTETGASEKAFTVGVNEPEGEGDGDVTCDKDELSVKAGDVIFYTHGSSMGQYEVKEASAESITLVSVLGSEIVISDAGKSYISVNGLAMSLNDAKAAGEILLAKVAGKAMVAGGASSELKTQFTTNATKLGK